MAQEARTTRDEQHAHRQQVISVRDLRKEFRGTRAVDGVSFDVRPGRVTGFLGPNGAGKTTTLRMILGLIRPTGGSALLWGSPYAELASPTRRIGVGLDGGAFVGRRTGRGHLRCYAPAAGCGPERVDRLLADVGLSEAADRPVAGYSTGMKQRLSLASALLGEPDLLILDEPANGLDPEGMLWLREFLRDFAASGRTVLALQPSARRDGADGGRRPADASRAAAEQRPSRRSAGAGRAPESAFLRLTRAGNGVRT